MFHEAFRKSRISQRYSLIIKYPDGSTHSFPVGDSAITVGRSPSTAIRVAEDGVSRQHCVISSAGGRLIVLDQDSTNGTYVNGAQVRQALLNEDDVIQVGNVKIRVATQFEEESLDSESPPTRPVKLFSSESKGSEFDYNFASESSVLWHLSERLACSSGTVSAGELVLDAVFRVFPVDRGLVITQHKDKSGITGDILVSRNRPDRERVEDIDESIPRVVVSLLSNSTHLVTASEATAAVRSALRYKMNRPILCTPFHYGRELIGALYLDALMMPEWAQSDHMLGYLSAIGSLGALALSRAQLNEQYKNEQNSSKEDKSKLYQLGKNNIDTALDLDTDKIKELKDWSEQVENLQTLRDTFTSAAHNLMATVTASVKSITNSLESITDDLAPGSRSLNSLNDGIAKVQSLRSNVEDIEILSKISAGNMKLIRLPVDISKFLLDVVNRNKEKALEKGVQLVSVDLESEIKGVFDSDVTIRIFDHLIDHCIEQSESEDSVQISGIKALDHIECTISYNGPRVTIDAGEGRSSKKSKDTEPFREQNYSDIYFCRAAMEIQGGSLEVVRESDLHHFVLTFPSSIQQT